MSRAMHRGAVFIVLVWSGVAVIRGQDATPTVARFDVASVKQNTGGDDEGSLGERPGGYGATNVPVRLLILRAYGIRAFHLIGGPQWMDSARWDVTARAPSDAPADQVLPMLRTLLADRFKLQLHSEMREQPVFALVRARTRFGPKLRMSSTKCSPPTSDVPNPCTMRGRFVGRAGSLKGVGQPLSELARQLGTAVERIVVDRTGLAGPFDFDLEWGGAEYRATTTQTTQGGGTEPPSIFTAIQEQLGLRLEPTRAPVEVFVVDSVARPDPD